MEKPPLAYALYMLLLAVFVGLVVAVPLQAFSGDMSFWYDLFGPTCHQKLSRSLCVFSGEGAYWIADCTPQQGEFINNRADRALSVEYGNAVGYKMLVCARDFGIYGAMLLGGLCYPFVRGLREKAMYPAVYLILSMVPIALDGGIQLLTEADKPLLGADILPFEYESTNAVRLLTGAVAGFAASFYAIPILVNIFSPEADEHEVRRFAQKARERAEQGGAKPKKPDAPAQMKPGPQ